MKFRAAVIILIFATIPLLGQELGLQQYLQRLKAAPGVTVEQKVSFLSNMGVTLSTQGTLDLTRASLTSRSDPAPSTWSSDDSPITRRSTNSTSNRIGGFTHHNFDNGVSGTSNRIGNFTHYNFSDGLSGTSNQVGNFSFQNWNNGLSGTSNRIGNFTFHNGTDGVSGTSNRIGNFEFHNFSDGTNCTTNKLGRQTYTNCTK